MNLVLENKVESYFKELITKELLAKTSLEKSKIRLESPKNREHGDLAFPCFEIAKINKLNPVECATKLAQEIEFTNKEVTAKAIGPFLNFTFSKEILINKVLEQSFQTKKTDTNKDKKILIEYSSPNIAKPFHVGHLRATLIGNSLDRVYRFLGFDVVSVNHLGDWGTQFGFVWAGCLIKGRPKEESVKALVDLYRFATDIKEKQEANQETEVKEDINIIARNYFLELEEGKKEALEFWKWCREISLNYLRETYKRLDISFDHYTGESFYSPMLEETLEFLRKQNLLVDSEGALGVNLSEASNNRDLGFARMTTADGRSLYLTRDIAAARYRAKKFNFDLALYVVGAPQALHFDQLVEILNKANQDYADKIKHIAFGHVAGMKTRGGGNFIELNDFLDEAYNRALDAYNNQVSKRPLELDEKKVATAVSLAAIIFSTLNKGRIKDVHFSWDEALAFQGDSGPYLLYAYARINSVIEKAIENGIIKSTSELSNSYSPNLLAEDSAIKLTKVISEFDDALIRVLNENDPTYLASYALELAKHFSKAYQELKVLDTEKNLAQSRLALFEATKITLKNTLELLGIAVIDRM